MLKKTHLLKFFLFAFPFVLTATEEKKETIASIATEEKKGETTTSESTQKVETAKKEEKISFFQKMKTKMESAKNTFATKHKEAKEKHPYILYSIKGITGLAALVGIYVIAQSLINQDTNTTEEE
jgi:hypothetical protein